MAWHKESKRHSDVQLSGRRKIIIPEKLKESYLRGQTNEEEYNRQLDAIEKGEEPKKVVKGLPEFAYNDTLTETEINLLKNRLSHEKFTYQDIPFPDDGYKITPEQTRKGLDWLNNLRKTPNNEERKNNPFGGREERILDDFKEFRLVSFYNISNAYGGFKFYIPEYAVISHSNGSFEYHINLSKKEKIDITA